MTEGLKLSHRIVQVYLTKMMIQPVGIQGHCFRGIPFVLDRMDRNLGVFGSNCGQSCNSGGQCGNSTEFNMLGKADW